MKSCDGCAECCGLLPIAEIQKAENTWCREVHEDLAGKRCGIHDRKPQSCVNFFCLWLMSQMRPASKDHLPDSLRPDRSHVVFYRNGTETDRRTIFAHVNPQFPNAWYSDVVSNEIARLINRGAIVIVQESEKRIIFQKGQPTVTTTAETANFLAGRVIDWSRQPAFGVTN